MENCSNASIYIVHQDVEGLSVSIKSTLAGPTKELLQLNEGELLDSIVLLETNEGVLSTLRSSCDLLYHTCRNDSHITIARFLSP